MDKYEPLEVIGSGSFGVIRKVRRRADGKILARKEIDYRKMNEKEKNQLISEVNILRDLRHPNIVRYYERCVDRQNSIIHILMEYCDGGDLAGVIRKCKNETKRIPEDMIWHLLTQLIHALHECHHGMGKHGNRPAILHRDLKPDNVFLDSANNVKLGDFGLSKAIENPHTEFANTYVGTPFYMSPELVVECRYNTKSDIWALGCLIYELCALEPPFQAKTQAQLAAKIRQGRFSRLPPMYSDELNHLIHVILQVDQAKRPGTKDLLMHERIQFAIRLKELSAREKEIKEMEAALKRREEEIEHAIKRREEEIRMREEELARREELLHSREAALAAHEEALKSMEITRNEAHRKERRPLADRHSTANNMMLDQTMVEAQLHRHAKRLSEAAHQSLPREFASLGVSPNMPRFNSRLPDAIQMAAAYLRQQ